MGSTLKIECRQATNGEYYLVLVGENGEDVMVGETYPTGSNAERAKKMILGATIVSDDPKDYIGNEDQLEFESTEESENEEAV